MLRQPKGPVLTAVVTGFLAVFALGGCSSERETGGAGVGDKEWLLKAHGARLSTLHSLPYQIKGSDDFRLKGPKHRRDIFNEVPYAISLAAFVGEDAALMVHAERVDDGSGASNYDNLDEAGWPDRQFRSSGAECITLEEGDAAGEHDLEWLKANGFDPVGTLLFQQYFASSSDYNDEVVLSFLARVPECGDADSRESTISALQSQFSIRSASRN